MTLVSLVFSEMSGPEYRATCAVSTPVVVLKLDSSNCIIRGSASAAIGRC